MRVAECADLLAHKGKAVILLGGRYEAKLHNAVHALNQQLGAYDSIIKVIQSPKLGAKPLLSNLKECFQSDVVIWLSPGNPCYDSPEINEAIVQFVATKGGESKFIHWGERTNHTALQADIHVPAANYLESWGDTRTYDGFTLVQPMIKPLYGGVTEIELLIWLWQRVSPCLIL